MPFEFQQQSISEGISLFTCCMNRNENLEKALPTWLDIPEVDEIVIVDWSSKVPVYEIVRKYDSEKIKLVRVEDQQRWILSYAFNLAARFTTRTKILKLDADVQVSKDFFRYHHLSQGGFFAGNWRTALTENEKHLNGVVYLLRQDFFGVNGYNEFITTYGWDDCDFYDRLEASGLMRHDLVLSKLHHLEHQNRTSYQTLMIDMDLSKNDDAANLEIQKNKFVAMRYPWSLAHPMKEFNVAKIQPNLYICDDRNLGESPIPNQQDLNWAENEALKFVIQMNTGMQFEELKKEQLLKLWKYLSAASHKYKKQANVRQRKWKLMTSLYNETHIERCLEFLECLHQNYYNPFIDEIYVFYDYKRDKSGLMLIHDYLYRRGVKIKYIEGRPTYTEFINYANQEFPVGTGVIVCNGDIYFDKSLERLQDLDLSDTILALTRWNLDKDGKATLFSNIEHYEAKTFCRVCGSEKWLYKVDDIYNRSYNPYCFESSQCESTLEDQEKVIDAFAYDWGCYTEDSWLFQVPLNLDIYSDFALGTQHCDSRFNFQLLKSQKNRVYNPCYDIKTHHLQLSEIRSTDLQQMIKNDAAIKKDMEVQGLHQDGLTWCTIEDIERDSRKFKLMVSLYNECDLDRINEYILCFERNYEHALIDEIHIFYDSSKNDSQSNILEFLKQREGSQIRYALGSDPEGTNLTSNELNLNRQFVKFFKDEYVEIDRVRVNKQDGESDFKNWIRKRVVIKYITGRPTYKQLFEYANSTFPRNSRVIIANADIYFNETLALLNDFELKSRFLVLSRWNVEPDGNLRLFLQENNLPNYLTADTWIFQTPLNIDFYCDYQLGTWFCDSFLNTQLLASNNLSVYNPCLDLQTCHLHLARRDNAEYRERVDNQASYWQKEYERNGHKEPNSGTVWCNLGQLEKDPSPRFQWLPRNLIVKINSPSNGSMNKAQIILIVIVLAEKIDRTLWILSSTLTQKERDFIVSLNDSRLNLINDYAPGESVQTLVEFQSLDDINVSCKDIYLDLDLENREILFKLFSSITSSEEFIQKMKAYYEYIASWEAKQSVESYEDMIRIAYQYFCAESYGEMAKYLARSCHYTTLKSAFLLLSWIESFTQLSQQYCRAFVPSALTTLPEWKQLLSNFVLHLNSQALDTAINFNQPELLKHQVNRMLKQRSKGSLRSFSPRVSLITSVFKGDAYIEHFLADITRQTIFDQCELILINPNSPENEDLVIKRYLNEYPNIIYRKLDYDPGLYEVWNMGILMSRGEYISNANLDDRRAPEHLERHIEILDKYPEVDVVSAALKVTQTANETWESNSAYAEWFKDFPEDYGAIDLFTYDNSDDEVLRRVTSQNIAHCMPVWRKELHKRSGYFDESTYGTSCDWEFWLRCAVSGAKFKLIRIPLGLYFENPTSHNRRHANKQDLEDKIIESYCLPLCNNTPVKSHIYHTPLLYLYS